MSMEERCDKTSKIAAHTRLWVWIAGEIAAITTRLPRGRVSFSRRWKMLKNKEIEREERDFIIYHTPPRTPACMTPARVRVRGGAFLVRFSFPTAV